MLFSHFFENHCRIKHTNQSGQGGCCLLSVYAKLVYPFRSVDGKDSKVLLSCQAEVSESSTKVGHPLLDTRVSKPFVWLGDIAYNGSVSEKVASFYCKTEKHEMNTAPRVNEKEVVSAQGGGRRNHASCFVPERWTPSRKFS